MRGKAEHDRVAVSFMQGRPDDSGSLRSDGHRLWSYARLLAEWIGGRLVLHLDEGRSSVTTRRHIAAFRRAADLP